MAEKVQVPIRHQSNILNNNENKELRKNKFGYVSKFKYQKFGTNASKQNNKSINMTCIEESSFIYDPDNDLKRFYNNYQQCLNNKLDKIDKDTINNIYSVSEYSHEISIYLKDRELAFEKNNIWENNLKNISPKVRALSIDWIINLHRKFKLLPETLYITIFFINTYMTKHNLEKSKIQCLILTSLYLASKYEEIYPPDFSDYLKSANGEIQQFEILKMEKDILNLTKFDISFPSSFRFLERYSKILRFEDKTFSLAQYIIELSFLDENLINITPSFIAAGSTYLAAKILKKESWNELLEKEVKANESRIKEIAKLLVNIDQKAIDLGVESIFQKFLTPSHYNVSQTNLNKPL